MPITKNLLYLFMLLMQFKYFIFVNETMAYKILGTYQNDLVIYYYDVKVSKKLDALKMLQI